MCHIEYKLNTARYRDIHDNHNTTTNRDIRVMSWSFWNFGFHEEFFVNYLKPGFVAAL